jgi:uncharacterized protein YceK
VRLALVLLVISLSGCGSCIDSSSGGDPAPSSAPAGRPASSLNRILQRAHTGGPGAVINTDAGAAAAP